MKDQLSRFFVKCWVMFLTLSFLMVMGTANAQIPTCLNLEGINGCGLNPEAYLTNPIGEGEGLDGSKVVGKPKFSYWHVNLGASDLDWDAISGSMTFYDRLEVGVSRNMLDLNEFSYPPNKPDLMTDTINLDSLSAKLQLIKENQFLDRIMPALSAGVLYKDTDFDKASDIYDDDSGFDYYAVASKNIHALPLPISLTAGIRSTKKHLMGALGFGDERDEFFFGNLQVVFPTPNFIPSTFLIGGEYVGPTDVGENKAHNFDFENHEMYDIHLAWAPTHHFWIVGSYLNTGDDDVYDYRNKGKHPQGFGGGWVTSFQYRF